MEFKNKVVLITGGSRGIGKEIARGFVDNGADVISISQSDVTSKKIDKGISNIVFDIRKTGEIPSLINDIIKKYKQIDILVNNAGVNYNKNCWDITDKDLMDELLVNFIAPVIFSKEVGNSMKQRRSGVIVNVGSIKGHEASNDLGYGASKAAMKSLTMSFAKELGLHGVRVNTVVPGFTETDMIKDMNLKKRSDYMEMIALGKFSTASDIAASVLFLASENASHITGVSLRVDGGYRL
ncbi:MAG: SDR family NAD(P)-dependent oxidoreductase [Candidatus Moranbacteria bacterium]|nr:SDR family NAD(P)-dependent oxidoreductase [Candidatus Moranbacteria bacterium]